MRCLTFFCQAVLLSSLGQQIPVEPTILRLLSQYDAEKVVVYGPADLLIGDLERMTPAFKGKFSSFKARPSLKEARALQDLASESLNPCEVIATDFASQVFSDRSEFSRKLARRAKQSKTNNAKIQSALTLIFRSKQSSKIKAAGGSGYSLSFVEPYELPEEVLLASPKWVMAVAVSTGMGFPEVMKKLHAYRKRWQKRDQSPSRFSCCALVKWVSMAITLGRTVYQEMCRFLMLPQLRGDMRPECEFIEAS